MTVATAVFRETLHDLQLSSTQLTALQAAYRTQLSQCRREATRQDAARLALNVREVVLAAARMKRLYRPCALVPGRPLALPLPVSDSSKSCGDV
jgi:hypothetical protein